MITLRYEDLSELNNVIRKIVIYNAITHNGRAKVNSVIGKLLSDHPELKKNISESIKLVKKHISKN